MSARPIVLSSLSGEARIGLIVSDKTALRRHEKLVRLARSYPMNAEPASAYRRVYDKEASQHMEDQRPGLRKGEMQLIDRAFALIPPQSRVLDLPCGSGRVAIHLAKKGYQVTAADLSEFMVEIARKNITNLGLTCVVERQDVERLTYPDRSFDAVICFRLFHHFPDTELRRRTVAQLCRVSGIYVVLSYRSPASFTSVRHQVELILAGKKHPRYPTPLREIIGYFMAEHFKLVKDFARMPLIHAMHLAVFRRAEVAAQ